MDFNIPAEIAAYIDELDEFIEREIRPLERENDNIRFFDHRREHARTDWDNDGQPRHEWEALLAEMRRRADKAGHLRFGLPKELGGKDGSNLAMAIIREHLAHKGLGLHNDLQNESSIVGNFPVALLLHRFGTQEQKDRYIEGMFKGKERIAFGLTEPNHGSDATFMETTATKQGSDWVINGMKRFNTGMHTATVDLVFARTSGKAGDARGISAFLVPVMAPGLPEVRANTRSAVAVCMPVLNRFMPLITQSEPCLTAVVSMKVASEPWLGSVRPKAMRSLPVSMPSR